MKPASSRPGSSPSSFPERILAIFFRFPMTYLPPSPARFSKENPDFLFALVQLGAI
jgi:hypothetical protein